MHARLATLLVFAAACQGEGEPSASFDVAAGGGVATVARAVNEGGPNPSPQTLTVTNSGNCALVYDAVATTVDGQRGQTGLTWLLLQRAPAAARARTAALPPSSSSSTSWVRSSVQARTPGASR